MPCFFILKTHGIDLSKTSIYVLCKLLLKLPPRSTSPNKHNLQMHCKTKSTRRFFHFCRMFCLRRCLPVVCTASLVQCSQKMATHIVKFVCLSGGQQCCCECTCVAPEQNFSCKVWIIMRTCCSMTLLPKHIQNLQVS